MHETRRSLPFAALAAATLLAGACSPNHATPAPAAALGSPASVAATAELLAAADEALVARMKSTTRGWSRSTTGRITASKLPPGLARLSSHLPLTADGAWEVGLTDSDATRLTLTPRGARPSPAEQHGSRAIYRDAWRSTDAIYASGQDFVELLLLLRDEAAPGEWAWNVRLPEDVGSARATVDGALEFVDARGVAILRMPRPYAVDAGGRRRDANLSWNAGSVTVRLDRRGLEFPILLDPVIEVGVWTQAAASRTPQSRSFAMAAFGAKAVLFGGWAGSAAADETWELDESGWTQRFPAHKPPGRAYAAMAALGGKLVLFGGCGTSCPMSDTWEWDGTDWTQRFPAHSPSKRTYHGMAALGGKVVLFGGNALTPTNNYANDTWEWDDTDWVERTPAVSPSPRWFPHLASLGNKVVLFGGDANGGIANDTWEWDGGNWTRRYPATSPSVRYGISITALNGKVVVFGGANSAYFQDTWDYDGVTWTDRTPYTASPSARSSYGLVTLGARAVLFGGSNNSGQLFDTWQWDGSRWWRSDAPVARTWASMAARGNKVLLFGGGGASNDTFETDGSSWTRKWPATSPSARSGTATASLGSKVVLFGGLDTASVLAVGDTWEWDGAEWTRRMPAHSPSAREYHAMAKLGDKVILFGGFDGSTILGDTWEWDGADWAQRAPAHSPNARMYHAMATSGSKVVLFGGNGPRGDTWEWDGTDWTQRTPVTSPAPRAYPMMAAVGGRVVLFAGPASGLPANETWEWDGQTWTQRTPSEAPSGRLGAAFAGLGEIGLLFGGNSGSTYFADLWRYSVLRAAGSDCSAASECASGFCVDRVCCDVACGGDDPTDCQACSVAAGAALDGTCAPLAAQMPCRLAAGDCDLPEACDGTQPSCPADRFVDAEQTCRAASCSGSTFVPAARCDGLSAQCPAAPPQSCAGYLCAGDACAQSCSETSPCAPSFWCKEGTCQAMVPPGGTCDIGAACLSGHCVDGRCCDSACAGACEACDVAGAEGACTPVLGLPHGARSCASDGSLCAGSCDGEHSACTYPDATRCRDGSCLDGVATPESWCDGQGHCPDLVPEICSPYLCSGTRCAGGCLDDAGCVGGSFCLAGQCQPKGANGGSCGEPRECASGFCVDGHCCESACRGQCEACDAPGSEGRCLPTRGAPHGGRPACAGSGVCGGSCDGQRADVCAYPGATVACREPSCAADLATLGEACDGAGACPAARTHACSPAHCLGSSCAATCLADEECPEAQYCVAGGCAPLLGNGEACGAARECASGRCVDGVCCDAACGGQCEACDVAGSEGSCSPVKGTPHAARPGCASDGSACGGLCDGVRAEGCAYPGEALECRPASCADGVSTLAAGCDGAGSCPARQTQACAPYGCGATTCAGDCTTDLDCQPSSFCSAGVCQPRKENGASCAAPSQCASGHCADGLCCETACTGQCEACDVAGSLGRCAPVSGAPHGGRTVCAGTGGCQGRCDGIARLSCLFPDSSTTCSPGTCSDGVAHPASACDGAGGCRASADSACGSYGCAEGVCRSDCSADDHCAKGYRCSAGRCVEPDPKASPPSCGCGGTGEAGVAPALAALLGLAVCGRRRPGRQRHAPGASVRAGPGG